MVVTERPYAPDIHTPLVPWTRAQCRPIVQNTHRTACLRATREVAAHLGVSVQAVRYWTVKLRLGLRLTSGWRYTDAELDLLEDVLITQRPEMAGRAL